MTMLSSMTRLEGDSVAFILWEAAHIKTTTHDLKKNKGELCK